MFLERWSPGSLVIWCTPPSCSILHLLIHLNSADITSLLAGILPHVPKPEDEAKGKEPTGRAQVVVVYWIGEDADDCVVFPSIKPSPSEMTCRTFGNARIGHRKRVLRASKMDTFPVRSLATHSGLGFVVPVEGITTPSRTAVKIVALPRQCPLPWVWIRDPPTVSVWAFEFTFNEDPSQLDGAARFLWKGVVPMGMLDKVVEALETRPCDTSDPVFNDFPGAHHVPAAHWWLSGNVKLGLIWGSVLHCNVFVLVCCAFCMLGNVHLMFLEVLDTHLVKVQGGGNFFLRRLS